MTDLSAKIPEEKSAKDIADYFGCPPQWVADAMLKGATTYQDVYNHIENMKPIGG